MCGVKSRGNQPQASKGLSTYGVTQDSLILPAWNYNTCEILSLREILGALMSRAFTGGWSHRYPLPSMYQNQASQREKTGVQHKPLCLFKRLTHNEPLSSVLGMVGPHLKYKSPDTSQWPTLHTDLPKDSSQTCYAIFFLFFFF